jgi:hypothetical protein
MKPLYIALAILLFCNYAHSRYDPPNIKHTVKNSHLIVIAELIYLTQLKKGNKTIYLGKFKIIKTLYNKKKILQKTTTTIICNWTYFNYGKNSIFPESYHKGKQYFLGLKLNNENQELFNIYDNQFGIIISSSKNSNIINKLINEKNI